MTTKDMLTFMKDQGYPLTLMANQSGVDYFALYRHLNKGSALSSDEKAAVWRFAMCQPSFEAKMLRMARRENTKRGRL